MLQPGCNRAATAPGRITGIDRRDLERGGDDGDHGGEGGGHRDVVYDLQGTLLEACSCGVLCPCWIGEDPDGGSCDAFVAYHFDAGNVRGVDIGGLSLVNVVHIPGNVLTPASWKIAMFIDERATDEQFDRPRGRVRRQAGRAAGRPGRPGRRGPRRPAGADPPRDPRRRPATLADRRLRLRRDGAVHRGRRQHDDAPRHRVLDGARARRPTSSKASTPHGQPPAVRDGVVVRGSQRDPVRLPHHVRGRRE